MGLAVATIVARNYLPHARVLADSFRRFHAGVPLFVLLVDDDRRRFDASAERFRLVHPEEVALPSLGQSGSGTTIKQVAVASKPFLLSWLLDQGYESALFLDPDILVVSELGSLFELVQQYSIVLTPHLTIAPRGERRFAREINIAQSGVFNGGVIGTSGRPAAREFLTWWGDRVRHYCHSDIAAGLYYDQRWLDLAPVFFRDLCILRDPTYNVAYWNLPEREINVTADAVMTGGERCRLIHFSGFDLKHRDLVTRYLPELRVSDLGAAGRLFERYASLLTEAGAR